MAHARGGVAGAGVSTPKPNRPGKKRVRRYLRAVRRDLVHAAGCTEQNCSTAWQHFADIVDIERHLCLGRVSVPRSLRRLLGWRL